MKVWRTTMPANIALIKYMGKAVVRQNIPTNASLSYTLSDLQSQVALACIPGDVDQWVDCPDDLTHQGQQRFLKHLRWMKKQLHLTQAFSVRSCNNFPADCGLASSASSFAALSACVAKAAKDLNACHLSRSEIAALSQQGSGSSCRSFFGPWSLWDASGPRAITLPTGTLRHHVVLVDTQKKDIPSSEAHQRVLTSPRFHGRPERAHQRLQALLEALHQQQWQQAFTLIWQEFEDMHALFETAIPPFSYRQPKTQRVLNYLQRYWDEHGDGPWVTMDAGPNVHLLFRDDQPHYHEVMQGLNDQNI